MVALLTAAPGAVAAEVSRIGTVPPFGEEPSYLCGDTPDLVSIRGKVLWPSGRDLWLLDPAPASLEVLRDFGAGPSDGAVGAPVDSGGRIFFFAADGFSSGLWTTDLSNQGTRLVAALPQALGAAKLTAWNGMAFFVARHPSKPFNVVWMSDGTDAGTTVVPHGPADPWLLQATPKGVFCATKAEGISGFALWLIDGTTSGSRQLATFPSPSQPHAAAPFGNGVLVVLSRGASYWNYELWRSDLTVAGTKQVAGLPDRVKSDDPGAWLAEAGSVGIFSLAHGFGQEEQRSLWRTNGTAAGTYAVAVPGADGFSPASPAFYTARGGHVLFAGRDAAHGVELWRTDGSAGGTALVADINPGSRGSAPQWLTAAGDVVHFSATDIFTGREPWVSDGSAAGTRRVVDLCPGPLGSVHAYGTNYSDAAHRTIAAAGDEVVVMASNGMGGCGLWVSDGTEAGTRLAAPATGEALRAPSRDVAAAAEDPEPARLLAVDGSVLTQFGGPWTWSDVWRSDGSPGSFEAITSPSLAQVFAQPSPARLHDMIYLGIANEVMRCDGTARGSAATFAGAMTNPSPGAAGVLYFWRDGTELWRSDGTPAGTRRVRRFPANRSSPGTIAQRDGVAYFAADDGVSGSEPWRSDGSDSGTVMIADMCAGSCSYSPGAPVVSGDLVYFRFSANSGLMVTDGSAAGSRALWWGWASQMAPLTGGLLFATSTGGLYFTSGAAGSVELLAQFLSLSFAPNAATTAEPQSSLLFLAEDDAHGAELWRSDGTAAGTSLVRDIAEGLESSGPHGFVRALGRTWFTASDAAHGAELWSSDGTENGTRLEADVEPGPRGFVPLGLAPAGERLVFRSSLRPSELWSARITPLPRIDAWDAWADAGTSGDGFARVDVTLAEPATSEVSVAYWTEDDTAKAGADYVAVGGRLTFPAGTAGPLAVTVPLVAGQPRRIGQLFVRLGSPSGGVVGRGSALVIVADDRAGHAEPRRRLWAAGDRP